MEISDGLILKTDDEACEALDALRKLGEYAWDVTGDACSGDEVAFARPVFAGSYRRPKFAGCEIVMGRIVRDSYGAEKQQHAFTIERADGSTMRIKGRNLYGIKTLAKPRPEEERREALADKHRRGEEARAARDARRESDRFYFDL